MSTRAATRTRAEVQKPFIAHALFEPDFELIWGRRPRCCFCGELVRAGELAGWLKAYRPETLHHVACRRGWADGANASGGREPA